MGALFMPDLWEFALLCFTSLFAMINPFGVAPVFQSMTTGMSHRQARHVALKASFTAFIILVIFALLGKFIFDFFSVSVNSLRVVGGVIFFMLGYELLQAKISRMKTDQVDDIETYSNDIAITPLAIPILCGPGAIANVIIFMHDGETLLHKLVLLGVISVVIIINYAGLVGASRLLHFLGDSGNKVMMRIMGLIVMVIAVEFFFSGLTPIVREMLHISIL